MVFVIMIYAKRYDAGVSTLESRCTGCGNACASGEGVPLLNAYCDSTESMAIPPFFA
ncbi:hypothetical protein [Cupriavidus basilensis]|uniref:hypothetical protein n=1 Tax=Cupriavidus basilensis TaxID=68895 RepID=UPI0039F701FA